jgi:hypothetical protein
VLTACFAGCKKKPADTKEDKKATQKQAGKKAAKDFNPYPLDGIKAALKKQGYDPGKVMEFDGNLYYAYEVAMADEYDAQFEAEIGELLGLLGGYTRETATVVCTGGGEPVMQFTAKKSDLIDFAAGKLKPGELFLKLKIEAMKPKK